MSRRPTIAWPPPLPNSLQCSQHVPFDRPCLAIIANLKLAVMCTAVCMLPYLSMHACLLSAISSAPCDSSAATVTRIGNRNLEEQGSRARKWFFGGGGAPSQPGIAAVASLMALSKCRTCASQAGSTAQPLNSTTPSCCGAELADGGTTTITALTPWQTIMGQGVEEDGTPGDSSCRGAAAQDFLVAALIHRCACRTATPRTWAEHIAP